MSMDTITDGKVVSLAYMMKADGIEVEGATADDPLDYLHGAQNILPGLERALQGARVGDVIQVTLQPGDAYGEYEDDKLETIDRDDLPEEQVEPGMSVLLEDEDGNLFDATIKEVNRDTVVLDMNDPLAGKVITYDVEVLAIRAADDEELENGYPAGTEFAEEDEYYYDDDFDEDDE
jgi:FKBP-type peptidyl-prolyl cis-trans isomerase SlyD